MIALLFFWAIDIYQDQLSLCHSEYYDPVKGEMRAWRSEESLLPWEGMPRYAHTVPVSPFGPVAPARRPFAPRVFFETVGETAFGSMT